MWNELVEKVRASDGVVRTTAGELRDIAGAERLGKHIRDRISNDLRMKGVGHLPAELPDRAGHPVILYFRPTPAGRLIEEIQLESTHLGVADQLRAVNTAPDPRDVVARDDVAAALRPLLDLMGEQ